MSSLTVALLPPGGQTARFGDEGLLAEPGTKWVDVEAPDADTLWRLAAKFGLHRLAIEDCLHLDQRPKLEEYPGHLFLVMQAFTCGEDLFDLTLHELHLFVGPDWILSVHAGPLEGIQVVRRALEEDAARSLGRGADFVAYLLMDHLVDLAFPLMDRFHGELEDLETAIFERADKSQLQRIFTLKRELVTLRRVLAPQREVVALLTRPGLPHLTDRTTLYFRDVYDHLARVYVQLDSARELVGNATEAYLSMVANRTNDITKQLTIFATLFLPLSFITGFFGQNFEVLSRPAFFWSMLGLLVAVPAGLMAWFRARNWW